MKSQTLSFTKATSKIISCVCDHPFQDQKYGKGQRVHNPCKPSGSDKGTGYKCSVCGRKV